MTTQKLIENAKANNATVYFDKKDTDSIYVKFNNESMIHVFTIVTGDVFFNYSFDQKTSKVKESLSHELRVKKSLGF